MITLLFIFFAISIVLLGVYLKVRWLKYVGISIAFLTIGFALYRLLCRTPTLNNRVRFQFSDDGDYPQEMYCGTDLLIPDGYDYVGTRQSCLKRGIGMGMSMSDTEIAAALTRPRQQQTERTYCGNGNVLPPTYDRFATPYECMKKGVGVGMRQPIEKRNAFRTRAPKRMSKSEITKLADRFKIPTTISREQAIRRIGEKMIESA